MGASSSTKIFIAGDGAGIGGAKAAEFAGQISAAEILHSLEKLDLGQRDELAKPAVNAAAKELAIRPFLDTLYAVPEFIRQPNDDVMICRCEEVRAGDIRKYAILGCTGPNQTKAFGRSGMGPCQGRYCAATVTEILAQAHDQHPDEIGSYRVRMPIKPVSLGEVASVADQKLTLEAESEK